MRRNRIYRILIYSVLFVISALFVMPVLIVFMNSFKSNFGISISMFSLPTSNTFVGFGNYITGFTFGAYNFFLAFLYSLIITVLSVLLILLATSMAAWFILRVNNKFCKMIYYLCIFSMVVPFQMVMFTMTDVCYRLGLNTVLGIIPVYLGFGSGLSVFMFSGFVKGLPQEIEEAAMIDGCSPIKTFFYVVFPILKPTAITVAILNAMWIWNDFLLPYLLLGSSNKTLSVAIQLTMQGAYGAIDWGGFMSMLVLAIIPIIIFYLFCQKYIIKGVIDGAVKG